MYKLLIVDDEPLVQVGIKSMLNCDKHNIEVCGIAGNGQAALDIIKQTMPDIVITDIKMPVMSGLDLIKECRSLYGFDKPAFIILTSYEDFHIVKDALKYQAMDYLVKLELTQTSLDEAINKAIERINAISTKTTTASEEQENLNNIHEKFYIKLLQNMFDNEDQYLMQKNYLHINLEGSSFLCVYMELFDHTGNNLTMENQFSLFASAMTMLQELIVKYLPAKIISLDMNHCAIIISFNDTSEKINIVEILDRLKDSLLNYYNISIKCGIGTTVTNPLEIAVSYQYARQAYSYLDDDDYYLSIDECTDNNYNHQIFNMSIFKEPLRKAFDEFDSKALDDIIKQLVAMFADYPKRNFQALDAACNILYIAISSLPNGQQTLSDLFEEYPDRYRSIYRQKTMDQIINWLEIFNEKMDDYFTTRKSTHKNHTVTMVKRYITEHITQRLSLNDIACQFNITPNYLSQLFKKYNDCGFNEFITQQKISEAKRLMAEGNLKIYEISDMLGFESSFYFSKVFKKSEGISPKDYINQKL